MQLHPRRKSSLKIMRKIYIPFVLLGAGAVNCVAQSDTLNARDMFWSSAEQSAPSKTNATSKVTKTTPAAAPTEMASNTHVPNVKGQLGLRYTILRALPAGGQAAVLPDTTFKKGDAIRLSIEANRTGYLYVIQQGSTGAWMALYPSPGQPNRVQPGREYIVPSAGEFTFDEHAGQERLFVLLSETPTQDLASLILDAKGREADKSAPTQDHSINDVISEIKLVDRDLVFAKPDKDAPAAGAKQQDKSVYVVNKNANGSRVVVDVVLQHQ